MVMTVLAPDTSWARAADWRDLPVRLVWYDLEADRLQSHPEAQILIDATGPTDKLCALLSDLPKLQAIQALYAGVERWQSLLPPGVKLINASGAHGQPTAEIGTAGLLALYRGLPGLFTAVEKGQWKHQFAETVGGKLALVIGAGDVGRNSARQLAALGAQVDLAARSERDGVRALSEAQEQLGSYDIVVLATPLTDDTRGLADKAFLARMKDKAVLVNIGRGPLVVTEALVDELTSGRLRAVLDVTDPEPLPEGHPLWTAPGLILTPHVGGSVEGAYDRAMRVAINQIAELVVGRRPANLVDFP